MCFLDILENMVLLYSVFTNLTLFILYFPGSIGGNQAAVSGGGAYKSVPLQALQRSPAERRHRDPAQGPLRKLSVDLIKTYKHINEVSTSICFSCCLKLMLCSLDYVTRLEIHQPTT